MKLNVLLIVRCAKTFVLLLFFCLSLFATAENARPKVGLVFGGGGAKGGAHIGVLKVLEANRIPIDFIAGTSVGSIIGALYALGYSADDIERTMLSIDWEEGYSDTIPRSQLPYRLKQRDQFNIPLSIGHEGYKIKMPSGLLFGQRASMLLRDAFGNISNFEHFDDLPIPFRAIATDLSSNEMVILDGGDMLLSVRASSNVPGILAPVQIGDKLLVDGGITNNLPIDIVRSMGADIVIAIDIGDTLSAKESLTDTFAILGQLSSFLTFSSTNLQKQHLREQDVLLQPNIIGLSTTDWSLFAKAIEEGQRVAENKLTELQKFSLSVAGYQDYLDQKSLKHVNLRDSMAQPITRLELKNKSSVHSEYIEKYIELELGETLSDSQINDAVERIYSLDEFQFVNATLKKETDGRALVLETQEKSWGPNFFDVGVGWETNFTDESTIDLDLAYTMNNLTTYGGEWRSQLELGNEPSLLSELYLPLDSLRQFYYRNLYAFESINWSFGSLISLPIRIEQHNHELRFGLGWNYSRHGLVEIGALAETGSLENSFLLNKDINYDGFGSYLRAGYDNLDSSYFPTQGMRLLMTLTHRNEHVDNVSTLANDVTEFGARTLQLDIDWKGAFNLGSHAFVGKAKFSRSYVKEGEESVHVAQLGGFLNLSGYSANALSGHNMLFASMLYQYNLHGVFKNTSLPVYLGFSAEAGNVWAEADSVEVDDLIHAGSIFLGTDTKMGPIALGYGANDQSEKSVYFYFGYKI